MTTRGVLIVDGHLVFADALSSLLRERGQEPVTTFDRGVAAAPVVERERPDVVLLGWSLADGTGVEWLRRLRQRPRCPPVVLLGDDDVSQAATAIREGASGFVPKSSPTDDVLLALSAVMTEGGAWLPANLLGPVLRRLVAPPEKNEWEERMELLTARETEIVELMVSGLDRPEISRRLGVSLNTVRTHTRNTLAKLQVHSSLEAVSVARRAGVQPTTAG